MMNGWSKFSIISMRKSRIFDEIIEAEHEMRMQMERKSENQGNIGKLRFDKWRIKGLKHRKNKIIKRNYMLFEILMMMNGWSKFGIISMKKSRRFDEIIYWGKTWNEDANGEEIGKSRFYMRKLILDKWRKKGLKIEKIE